MLPPPRQDAGKEITMPQDSLFAAHPLYCRFDNRMVGCCPKLASLEQCPIRIDCAGYRKLVHPSVAPAEVHPRG